MLPESHDRELMEGLLRSDRKALAELYRCYKQSLQTQILQAVENPAVVNALVQETVFYAWTHSHDMNRQIPIGMWLSRIADNRSCDYQLFGRFYADAPSKFDPVPRSGLRRWVRKVLHRSQAPFVHVRGRLWLNL